MLETRWKLEIHTHSLIWDQKIFHIFWGLVKKAPWRCPSWRGLGGGARLIFKQFGFAIKIIFGFSFTARQRSRQCASTRISVVKTIRLSLSGVLPWIAKHPTMKVDWLTFCTLRQSIYLVPHSATQYKGLGVCLSHLSKITVLAVQMSSLNS